MAPRSAQPSSTAEPNEAATSVSELVTWLRERIRIGRYMPGQRLIEPDLMRETGNSRGRVREALQRLQTEGLVVIEEFRGASVRTFTPDDMRQIYRARMALEGLAAHDCAAFGSDDAKTMIRDLQEQMNGCEHTGEHRRFAQLNDAWHDAIIAAADNEYLRNFIVRLRVPLYRLLFSAFYEPERIDDANAGHRQITDAIVIGDAETAERLMRAHVAEAMAVAIRLEEEMASS